MHGRHAFADDDTSEKNQICRLPPPIGQLTPDLEQEEEVKCKQATLRNRSASRARRANPCVSSSSSSSAAANVC